MSEVTEDKKADAEAGEKLDKVLAAMDSIAKRMDALEAKKADEEEPKADEDEARDDADEYEDDEEGTLEEEVKGDADEYEDEDEEFEEDPKRARWKKRPRPILKLLAASPASSAACPSKCLTQTIPPWPKPKPRPTASIRPLAMRPLARCLAKTCPPIAAVWRAA